MVPTDLRIDYYKGSLLDDSDARFSNRTRRANFSAGWRNDESDSPDSLFLLKKRNFSVFTCSLRLFYHLHHRKTRIYPIKWFFDTISVWNSRPPLQTLYLKWRKAITWKRSHLKNHHFWSKKHILSSRKKSLEQIIKSQVLQWLLTEDYPKNSLEQQISFKFLESFARCEQIEVWKHSNQPNEIALLPCSAYVSKTLLYRSSSGCWNQYWFSLPKNLLSCPFSIAYWKKRFLEYWALVVEISAAKLVFRDKIRHNRHDHESDKIWYKKMDNMKHVNELNFQ